MRLDCVRLGAQMSSCLGAGIRIVAASDRAAALKAVGRPADMPLPQVGCSMSHSCGLSVAAAAEDATRWLGIDLQRFEGPSTGSERLFLHLEERAALDSLGSEERDDARLRLWTVKEALFKSDPENESAWIGEYFIDSPLRLRGTAHRDASAHFRWACRRVRGGWLSAALRTES